MLALAHEHVWSGHLGITKMYDRILRQFFYPGLKADVAHFCRTYHTCQLTGHSNQKVPSVPLHPVPDVGTPFEYVIIDCVGQWQHNVCTIMCVSIHFLETVPLRKISSQMSKALKVFHHMCGADG